MVRMRSAHAAPRSGRDLSYRNQGREAGPDWLTAFSVKLKGRSAVKFSELAPEEPPQLLSRQLWAHRALVHLPRPRDGAGRGFQPIGSAQGAGALRPSARTRRPQLPPAASRPYDGRRRGARR